MSEKGDLRLAAGMVGGGEGADIGKSHRHAMRLDGHYDLVAGVFGRDSTASTRMAERLGVPADRAYRDFAEMAEGESARTDGVDVVTVATRTTATSPSRASFCAAASRSSARSR